jgi:hypothetical protein
MTSKPERIRKPREVILMESVRIFWDSMLSQPKRSRNSRDLTPTSVESLLKVNIIHKYASCPGKRVGGDSREAQHKISGTTGLAMRWGGVGQI